MRQLKIFLLLTISVVCLGQFLPLPTVHSQSTSLSAPTGVSASDAVYANKIGISWDAIHHATSYRIFRNTVNDPTTAVDLGTTATATFFDTTALTGQTYFYWVRAEGSGAAGGLSLADQGTRANGTGGGQALNPPPEPFGNSVTASKAYLGKALFWEEQLASTRTVACGTCHIPNKGGVDPRSLLDSARATHPGSDNVFGTPDDIIGSPGVPANSADGTYRFSSTFGFKEQVTARRSVSHIDAGYANSLFWDGRATQVCTDPISNTVALTNNAALESQVLQPPVNASEMGHAGRNWNDVAARVAASRPLALATNIPAALQAWINGRSYAELFAEAFGSNEVTPIRIAMAIAAYERTLYSDRTPFDQAVSGIAPLSAAEQRGQNVFNQSGCAGCHGGPLFTDNNFHYTGARPANEDTGRFQITGNNNDMGRMRTPGLRNIELRAPYMHNGRFATLEDVVEFYNRGGDFNAPNKDRRIRPLNLSPQQRADLVAFLKRPLTDPRVAAQTAPFDRPTLYSESSRVPHVSGAGVSGSGGMTPQVVALEPPLAGNPSFTVGIYNAKGGAQAILVIDENPANINSTLPPVASFAHLAVQLEGTGDGKGFASVTLAIPDNHPALIGATLFGRWFVFDANASGGLAATPIFQMTIFGEATPDETSNIRINTATTSGKNLFLSGAGFERGDLIEINGQQAAVVKFIDGANLKVKKGAKLLLACDAANPGRANIIKLIRLVNGSPVTLVTKVISACP
ncbi:MAG: cytochrome c peroxidase [Acidobacteriota bacterium]